MNLDLWYRLELTVWNQTPGLVLVLVNHTRLRGPIVAHVRLFLLHILSQFKKTEEKNLLL